MRVPFAKSADGWQPVCDPVSDDIGRTACASSTLSQPKRWSTINLGLPMASVTTAGFVDVKRFSTFGLLALAPGSAVSWVGDRSMSYAGWDERPVFRPLLARFPATDVRATSSAPILPNEIPRAAVRSLLPRFREALGLVRNCTTADFATLAPWAYADSNVSAVGWIVDPGGNTLIGLALESGTYRCDGPTDESWSHIWFIVRANGRVERLQPPPKEGSAIVSMLPIGATDVDGDGSVEVVFWLSGYNRDGYALYSGESRTPVTFLWGYH